MQQDGEKIPRVNVSRVHVRWAEPLVGAETPMETFTVEKEEASPWKLSQGTKRALLRGMAKLRKLHAKAENELALAFGGFSCTVLAVSDATWTLRPMECYVVSEGTLYTGQCAVYRQPCALATDVEVWTAKPLPPGVRIPGNSVVISRKGHVNSRLAGGDCDGDQDCVVFDPLLVEFLERTEPWVRTFEKNDPANSGDRSEGDFPGWP